MRRGRCRARDVGLCIAYSSVTVGASCLSVRGRIHQCSSERSEDNFTAYGRGAGGSIGFSVRYQGLSYWQRYWGSGTFKIVILVENHPQKPKNRLADYHPLGGWGVSISGQIYIITLYVQIGG
eukprot:scaffold87935_cov50-Phaeocystis_antarctica.AAC.1